MNNARTKLGISNSSVLATQLPYQPLMINIASSTKSGCNKYYRLLRKKNGMNSRMSVREEKWHLELGYNLSSEFWNKTYKLASEIEYDNRVKWLQFQINRNSLYTNHKVHKFNPLVSPNCTFCLQSQPDTSNLELISHLFASCTVVRGLWAGVGDWLDSLDVRFRVL